MSFADDARVDDSYFESLVAERSTVPADECPPISLMPSPPSEQVLKYTR